MKNYVIQGKRNAILNCNNFRNKEKKRLFFILFYRFKDCNKFKRWSK